MIQQTTNNLAMENKGKIGAVEAVKRTAVSKPVVVALLNEWEYDEFLSPYLSATSWPFDIQTIDAGYTDDMLIDTLNQHKSRVLMTCWSARRLPVDLFPKAVFLKYIVHLGGAVGCVIPRELVERGLTVSNWGDAAARPVAEHSLLQVLSCLRKSTRWQVDMHTHRLWREKRPEIFSLFGRRVGIYGYGVSAREFVKLLVPFGCEVSTFSESLPEVLEPGVQCAASLEELFKTNEIIVVLEALTERTFGSVDEQLLRMLPENGVFVNTARGPIVDEAALAKIASERNIQIALDVFEKEPLPESSPLRGHGNIFLTPHIAGPTTDTRSQCGLYALENVKTYFSGNAVKSQIGLERYDRMSSR